jgi:hypothetical protein
MELSLSESRLTNQDTARADRQLLYYSIQHTNLPECSPVTSKYTINFLPHIFNVKIRIYSIKSLQIPFNIDLKFISFDITNIY